MKSKVLSLLGLIMSVFNPYCFADLIVDDKSKFGGAVVLEDVQILPQTRFLWFLEDILTVLIPIIIILSIFYIVYKIVKSKGKNTDESQKEKKE